MPPTALPPVTRQSGNALAPATTSAPAEPPAYNPAHALKIESHTPSPKLTSALEALAGTGTKEPPAQRGQQQQQPATEAHKPLPPAKPPAPFKLPDDEGYEPERESRPPTEAPAPEVEAPAEAPAAESFKTNNELRDAYKRAQAELQSAKASGTLTTTELATLKAEVTAAKERLKALEPLESEVKITRERLTATEERLRIADYTQSSEFHEQHVKPLSDASASAERWISQLKVRTSEDTTRPASGDDFKALLRLDYTTAFDAAKQMFGPEFAGRVMDHYEKVQDLLLKRDGALKDASVRSQEWVRSQAERQQSHITEVKARLYQTEEALRVQYKELYTPPDDDQEAQEAYKLGRRLVDLATEPSPEMTQDDLMKTIAKTRSRAAAFPLEVLRRTRAEKKVAELEAKLKSYEGSEPAQRSPISGSNGNGNGGASDLTSRLKADLIKVAGRRI